MSSNPLSRRLLALAAATTMVVVACGNPGAATPGAPAPSPIVITDVDGFAFGIAGAMHVPGFDQPVATTSGVLALISTPQFLTAKSTTTVIKGDPSKVDPRWTAILATAESQLSKTWTGGFSAADPIAIYAGPQSAAVESRRHSDGSLNQADLPPITGLSSAQLLTLQIADSVPPAILATGQNEFVTGPGHTYSDGDNFDLLAAIGAARTAKDTNLEASLTVLARNNRNQYNIRWANRWALLSKNANATNGYAKIIAAEQAAVTLADPTAPITEAMFTFPTDPGATPGPTPSAAPSGLSAGTLGAQADPRWGPILERAATALAAGAQCVPASAVNPIPLYAGTQSAAVEARRRADGSLDPADLPTTLGLTGAQATLLRIADSVPNSILLTGQNEGVPVAGRAAGPADAYDLLAWAARLRAMAVGTVPPLVQDNGYVWTANDIARNLALANSAITANQNLYNLRWQTRWSLLEQNGYGAIADTEEACVGAIAPSAPAPGATVIIPVGTATSEPGPTGGSTGGTTGDQLLTVPYVVIGGLGAITTPAAQGGLSYAQIAAAQAKFIAAQDAVLQATGLPDGHDGSARGETTPAAALQIAAGLGLVRELTAVGLFGDPAHPTVSGADFSAYSRVTRTPTATADLWAYHLYVDGQLIASENGGPGFDATAFALRHNAPQAAGYGSGPTDIPLANAAAGGPDAAPLQVPISPANVATISAITSAIVDKLGAGTPSVTAPELQLLLAGQPDLLARAVALGYFGVPGTYPNIDYSGFSAQVISQTAAGPSVVTYQAGKQTSLTTQAPGSAVAAVGLDANLALANNPGQTTDYGTAANVPGMSAVSQAAADAWTASLGGNYAKVGDPDPAYTLAKWLEVAKRGTFLPGATGDSRKFSDVPAASISSSDLAIGLAWAQAYAAQNGVTPTQLTAAQARLTTQLAGRDYNLAGGIPPYNKTPYDTALQQATFALSGGHTFSAAQISYLNLKGGYVLAVINGLQSDPQFAALASTCVAGDAYCAAPSGS